MKFFSVLIVFFCVFLNVSNKTILIALVLLCSFQLFFVIFLVLRNGNSGVEPFFFLNIFISTKNYCLATILVFVFSHNFSFEFHNLSFSVL